MAFFEQLRKKITDAGQGVAKQTKDFADVARLNSAIADKEKKISQLYAALGEAYYKTHARDDATEERETIGEINALFDEIARQREEIKQIKGVTKCPSCGACGGQLPQTEAPARSAGRVCPNCGAAVSEDNLFCVACGTKVDDNDQQGGG